MSGRKKLIEELKDLQYNDLLRLLVVGIADIEQTLTEMKEQERKYWDTWKLAKEKERGRSLDG